MKKSSQLQHQKLVEQNPLTQLQFNRKFKLQALFWPSACIFVSHGALDAQLPEI
jgi:hypothetical protein